MMCLTQRENSYYHATQIWIKHILHTVRDFDRKINGVENTNILGIQREHLTTLMDMYQITSARYVISLYCVYRHVGLSICSVPLLSLHCLLYIFFLLMQMLYYFIL